MTKSTPTDLAVAFRSLGRRRSEALDAAEDAPVGGLLDELGRQIAAAAALVGSIDSADAVADAIEARAPKDWHAPTLDALRGHALEAGVVLRRIAESGPED